jgi:subtilisin family serine protease
MLLTSIFSLFMVQAGATQTNSVEIENVDNSLACEYQSGEVLAHFGNLSQESITEIKNSLQLRTRQKLPQIGTELLEWSNSAPLAEMIAGLRDRGVFVAEPNCIRHTFVMANDPKSGSLYGLTTMKIPAVWEKITGSDLVIAVVDAGGDWTHEDLRQNSWINPGEDLDGNGIFDENDRNGIDDDGNGYIDDVVGYDFVDQTPMPYKNSYEDLHGTHVSGTIGAVGNNAIGISGVMWQVKIMRLKFITSNGGTDFAAAKAIIYAVDNGARVINNSYGGYGSTETLKNAVAYANTHNVVFVAAAGNDRNNNDQRPIYPASYDFDNVIAVAATDASDNFASFSNFGKKSVDVAAPGVNILSTVPNNGYYSLDGTSMASPHVAGIAGLLLTIQPDLTPLEIRELLMKTSDHMVALKGLIGAEGRINALNAVECLTTGNKCDGEQIQGTPPQILPLCGVTPNRPNSLAMLPIIFWLVILLGTLIGVKRAERLRALRVKVGRR